MRTTCEHPRVLSSTRNRLLSIHLPSCAMSGQTQDDSPTGRPSDVALQMGPLLSSPAIPAYRAQQSSSLPLSKANTADCAEMDQVAAAAAAASRRARGPVVLFDQGDRPSGQSRPSVQRGLGQWTSMKSRFTAEEAAKGPGSDFEAPGTAKFAEERTTAQNYFQIKQSAWVKYCLGSACGAPAQVRHAQDCGTHFSVPAQLQTCACPTR